MGHAQQATVDAPPAPSREWPALNGLVDELLATRRRVASAQAAEARVFARAVDLLAERIEESRRAWPDPGESLRNGGTDLPLREIALELGMAIRISDRTVQARIGQAWTLVERFPAALAEWETGTIDAGHAWAIVHAGATIHDEQLRARYERLALDAARTESPTRFSPIAARIDPDGTAELIDAARAERRVRLCPLGDGLARLIADLPAPLAHAVYDRLTALATAPDDPHDGHGPAEADDTEAPADDPDRPARTGRQRIVTGPAPQPSPARGTAEVSESAASDARTTDQRRADALAELLLTGPATCHGDGTGAIAGGCRSRSRCSRWPRRAMSRRCWPATARSIPRSRVAWPPERPAGIACSPTRTPVFRSPSTGIGRTRR
ncbi:MAG: DUF222 domain-containing protein [Microbacterium sp.]